MEEYFTFRRCLEYIDDFKEVMVFASKKGSEVPNPASKTARKNKVFVAVSDQEQAIILPVGEHYHVLRFAKNRFFGEKGIRTLKRYQKDEFRIDCYQVSVAEFLSWFDESRFFAEEVAVSEREAQILKKHAIDVPKAGKTTRRYLKEAYQQAVSQKTGPEVEKIVQKYCKPSSPRLDKAMSLELEHALHEKEDAVVEIRDSDSAVFTKYGISLTQKTNYKDVKAALQKVNTKKTFSLKTVSQADMEVFQKYGIKFTPTGEVVGRVKPPIIRASRLKIAGYSLLCLAMAAAVVWLLWGDRVLFAVDDFVNRQKNKLEVNRILKDLKDYQQVLETKAKAAATLSNLYEKEYPVKRKISERIVEGLSEAARREENLRVCIAQGEELVGQKKFARALRELKENCPPELCENHVQYVKNLQGDIEGFVRRAIAEDSGKFDEYCLAFEKETENAYALWELFGREYPPGEDYLKPHSLVFQCITEARRQIPEMKKILAQREELLKQGNFIDAIHWLKLNGPYPDSRQIEMRGIARANAKMQGLHRINSHLKKQFLVQKTIRGLRGYLLQAGIYVDALEEKIAFLKAEYPSARVPIDPKIEEAVSAMRHKVGQIEQALAEIDTIHATSPVDHEKVEELLQHFSLDLSDIDKFEEFAESLDATEQGLKTLENKDMLAEYEGKLDLLRQRRMVLERAVDGARRRVSEAEKIPADFHLPVPPEIARTLDSAQQEIRMLEESEANARRLLEEKKPGKVQDIVDPLLEKKSSLPEVEIAARELSALLQIAETMKIERSQRTRQFSELRLAAQKQLDSLSAQYGDLQKEAETLHKDFPQPDGFPPTDKGYLETTQKALAAKQGLESAIAAAEDSLKRKDLDAAYRAMEGTRTIVPQAQQLADQVQKLRQEVAKRLEIGKKEKKRRQKLERVEATLQKIERNATRLQGVLAPIEKDSSRLEREFPAAAGYPAPPVPSVETLEKARKKLTSYLDAANTARKFLTGNEVDNALKTLAPYESEKLDKEFLDHLTKVQQEFGDMLSQAEAKKKKNAQTQDVDKYLVELRQRRSDLARIIPALRHNLERLQGYSTLAELGLDPKISNYVKEGEMELRDLDSLIAEAELLLKDYRYPEATKLLRPYSASVNRDISVVKLLDTFLARSEKALAELSDPAQKKKLEEKMKKQEEYARRMQQLSRPPGTWYREVQAILTRYEKIGPRLNSALEDHGSRIVHSSIDIQVRKIKEYPETVAELDDMMDMIRQKGRSVEAVDLGPHSAKIYQGYLKTKNVDIEAAEELQSLASSIAKLEDQLQMGGWVEKSEDDDPLKNFLRSLQSIDRKYKENYRIIQSPLLNIKASLPN